MSKWGILCPGPSLALYETQKKISLAGLNTLAAVNGAILLSDFRIDYWAMQDIEVFESIVDKADLSQFYTTRLWIPRRWLQEIPADHNKLNYHFQAFYKETFPAESSETFEAILPFKFNAKILWHDFTTLTAIGLAIISGATEIRLYGADMAGKGYFLKGLDNYRARHHEARWNEEKESFDNLVQESAKHGITIIREIAK